MRKQLNAPDRLLTIAEVKRAVGVRSSGTIYVWVQNGRLPRPRKLGVNRWLESEIQAFIARDADAA
jgi:predicted DNA-binding transcriptional regulator AlpA